MKFDDVPFNSFHFRAVLFCGGSLFLDGYVLGVGGFALASWGPQVDLSPTWYGAIGSATLFGLFAGSLAFGRITDRFGRKPLFFAHLVALLLLSPVQALAQGPLSLFAVRFLMGVAIGADFTIAITMLAELVPRRRRGLLLSCLNVLAIVGLALAYPVKAALDGLGDSSWRWLLASSAVPAVLVLLLRIGAPESPRWLLEKGRQAEARAVLDRFYGTDVQIEAGDRRDPGASAGMRELFSRRMWRRTVFAGGFWACQGLPYYAIYIFQGQISEAVGLGTGFWPGLVFNLFLLLGAVAGLPVAGRAPRRGMLLWTFAVTTVALAVLAGLPKDLVVLHVAAFAVFALVLAAATNLQSVYPGELFPTELRATGVGVATAISRIGACVGTFLLPIVIDRFGIQVSLYGLAAVLALGFALTRAWAPETQDLALAEASRVAPPPAPPGDSPGSAAAPRSTEELRRNLR
ncbi:MFS transporter [Kitasatospora sp. NPDC004799]|uniref:MFS transporter n=1 Tax=Kitasatospora sp. NPDC004799 TaxID=3154460 RepID=UPI0033A19209